MQHPDHNVSPFNAVPPVVVLTVLVMAAIEIAVELGAQGYVGGPQAVGWRLALVERFSFSGPLMEWMIETRRFLPGEFARFVTYPFVHGSFTHMAFAAVFTLALGKFVGEAFSATALAALWVGSAILAALAHMALTTTGMPLFGGMPPAYGLIGAFTWLLWQRARATGQPPLRAFQLIGFLVLLQIAFSLIEGGLSQQMVAELAGFAGGFLLSFVFAPGGFRHLLAALRQR